MPVFGAENSTISEPVRLRGPRNVTVSDPDSNPRIPSIVQSARCKSTIASLLSTFTNTQNRTAANNHYDSGKKSYKNPTLRRFGCTAHPEVAVPEVIRTSADWGEKRETRSKGCKDRKKKGRQHSMMERGSQTGSIRVQDVWCGPGIGGFPFATDAAAAAVASVDCVVSGRPLSDRVKIDTDKVNLREQRSYSSRQRVNPEHYAHLDLNSAFEVPPFRSDLFEARCYHHLRNRSPEGLAEIMIFQNGFFIGGRSDAFDRHVDWRLDVDHMSYEELLELGDRIGYVSTGLEEDEIRCCIRETKLSFLGDKPSRFQVEMDGKCSICQEEYEAEDEMGKLDCGHAYHIHCIKLWLAQKNCCPICKGTAGSR